MRRPSSLTASAVLLGTVLALAWLLHERGSGAAPTSWHGAVVTGEVLRAPAELAEGGVRAPALAPSVVPRDRHTAGPGPEVAGSAPAAVPHEGAVAGVVTDAEGRPLSGAKVWHELIVRPAGMDEARATLWSSDVGLFGNAGVQTRVTTTDRTGAFLFDETRTADGGRFYATAPGYLDEVLRAEVDRDAAQQVLCFPPTPHQDSVWTVDVVDVAGRPLQVDGASVYFLARTLPGTIRESRPDELEVHLGRVVVRGLPPGRFALHVDVQRSLGSDLEWTNSAPSSTQHSRLVLEPLAVGELSSSSLEPTAEGVPWVDEAAGLLRWIPTERLALGEATGDRTFAATLRCGFGAIRAAELVLDLRGAQVMCENDSLSLEFTLGAGFGWQTALRKIVPVEWREGARARVRLDLTRLPLADGTTLDFREHLADGLLDVVIEDDTAVEGVWLRVVR